MQRRGQRLQDFAVIHDIACHHLDRRLDGGGITGNQRLQQAEHGILVQGAEHRLDLFLGELPTTVDDGLVEQAQAIAQAAVGGNRDQVQGGRPGTDVLGFQNVAHLAGDLFPAQPPQVELQATRQHRHQQFLRIGGGEQEFHMPGRFFQRLEQGIEGIAREHVHFVDQKYFEAPARRPVLGTVDQIADIIHAGVRCGVNLDQVDKTTGIDIPAHRTLTAGLAADAALAVQRFGKNPGDGGLAHAAGSGEQEGVVHAAGIQRLAQRGHHVFLADQLGKCFWPPLPGQGEIAHGVSCRPAILPERRRFGRLLVRSGPGRYATPLAAAGAGSAAADRSKERWPSG